MHYIYIHYILIHVKSAMCIHFTFRFNSTYTRTYHMLCSFFSCANTKHTAHDFIQYITSARTKKRKKKEIQIQKTKYVFLLLYTFILGWHNILYNIPIYTRLGTRIIYPCICAAIAILFILLVFYTLRLFFSLPPPKLDKGSVYARIPLVLFIYV